MFNQKSRPFFKSTRLLALEPIPEAAYIPFAQKQFKTARKSISADIVKKAIDWSRGQTYYTQLIMNKLYESAHADDARIQQVFDEIVEEKKHTLAVYQSLMTPFQWKVLNYRTKRGNQKPAVKNLYSTIPTGYA